LACALAVRDAYTAVLVSGDQRVAVAVLRPCDVQPLPEHVPTAAVELVAKRSSKLNALSAAAAGVEQACLETAAQTLEADIDITPFGDLASCQAARDVLEERERKDQEAAKRDGLAWLDGQAKHVEQEIDALRSELADFDARKKQEARSPVDRELAAIERNRLVRGLTMSEQLLSALRARLAEEERRPPEWIKVFECRRTPSPS
jgi:hypothetical protein